MFILPTLPPKHHRGYSMFLHHAILAAWLVMTTVPSHGQDASQVTRSNLNAIASHRIFFGHQSVGDNLLDGLRALAREAQVPLNITLLTAPRSIPARTFGHTYVADNTQPMKKLASFELAMGQLDASVDIALLKFCYVDINAETDVKQLFEAYRQTIQRLKVKHPGTRFLHVTTPLTTVQTGWKATIKSWIGKPPYGVLENARREEYNNLMRQAYAQKEPVFDLAGIEAMLPDGRIHQATWQGKVIPALAPIYSHDGEHLNATGQLHAARGLVAALKLVSPQPYENSDR